MSAQSLFREPKQKITLRPYQREALQAIEAATDRDVRRQLLVLATGLGKTSVFGERIRTLWERNERSKFLVLAHREELLEQGARRIQDQNPMLRVGIESGQSRASYGCDVIVGSVATLGRKTCSRIPWFKPTQIITDEAHHACADGYLEVYRRYGVFDEGANHLGVTATPHRLDNKPLHGTEKAIFDEVPYMYTLKDGVLNGWLADIKGYRCTTDLNLDSVKIRGGDFASSDLARVVNTDSHNEFAVDKWFEKARDRKTVVFCVNVAHAHAVCAEFARRGIVSAVVDGTTDKHDRRKIFAAFDAGDIHVLCNCEVATEGWDCASVRCVLMLRPTKSWALFTQCIGRGTRTLPGIVDLPGLADDKEARLSAIARSGKPDCLVLDVVDNTDRHSAASLPSIVGLPAGLDLDGHSVNEAHDKISGASEFVRGALFARQFSMDGIDRVLREVDLLAELKVADEAVGASRYSWLKVAESTYVLSCGSSDSEKQRQGVLSADVLGNWSLTVKSDKRSDVFTLGSELSDAFRHSDNHLVQAFGSSIGAVAGKDVKWKSLGPSDKQVSLLKKLKVPDDLIRELDRGSASALITRKMSERSTR